MLRLLWPVLSIIGCIYCSNLLDRNINVVKPRYEINKVNKGVWLRHKQEASAEKGIQGNFIFRPNSLDAEINAQNGFDLFAQEAGNTRQAVSDYIRDKRSPQNNEKPQFKKKSTNKTKTDTNVTPVYNDYPYEVTVLLGNENNKNVDYHTYPKYETGNGEEINKTATENLTTSDLAKELKKETTNQEPQLQDFKDVDNATEGNVSSPKRSMPFGAKDIKRINLFESLNKVKNNLPLNFLKGDRKWHTGAITNSHSIPKEPRIDDPTTPKPISERGLIKVLSMLTKTFKKIMKQHNDMKIMHTQMQNINDEFKANIELHAKKLQDFDIKYLFFLNIMEKLKLLQEKLRNQEESYRKKDEQMGRNLIQFETQQKKFLAQQQQFFNLQKLILAQNEKINQKQNSIAKTQTELSHRQNSFARVLEKVKKLYGNPKLQKLTNVRPKTSDKNVTDDKKFKVTPIQTTTESITINLFSIPASNPIENQDRMILNEKDDRTVDELIYKYYFNNTFIDTIIKNKILSGFFLGDKGSMIRNAKHKRNGNTKSNVNRTSDSTVLLPVYNVTNLNNTLKRERRWINHHSKTKHKRRYNGKRSGSTRKPIYREDKNKAAEYKDDVTTNMYETTKEERMDPFQSMATLFCKQIGQNETKQVLDWCVEKALRRLKSIDTKMIPKATTVMMPKTITQRPTTSHSSPTFRKRNKPISKKAPSSTVAVSTTAEPFTMSFTQQNNASAPGTDGFFPDNEELESNLKQFDITKDVEGNVYYDGSVHASDLFDDKTVEFLPDFESNSKIEIDPKALEQSLRHLNIKSILRHNAPRTMDPRL